MIELVLHNPRIQAAQLEHGDKALIFVDPESGITVTTALDKEAAKGLGGALAAAGIEIARKLPGENGAAG